MAGFNPSVGILWGGTPRAIRQYVLHREFQSLGRDSVGWDLLLRKVGGDADVFQSLGRDSVGWDCPKCGYRGYRRVVSIPRSGFCGVGLPEIMAVDRKMRIVSIPRSGFCGVGLRRGPNPHPSLAGFNPSVGILWGGTSSSFPSFSPFCFVSIPRSGFCGVGQTVVPSAKRTERRFQSLGRDSVGWDCPRKIVVARTRTFQSLGRDSVGWDQGAARAAPRPPAVSIPRSGFCGVGLSESFRLISSRSCFNPSVGILWGGTYETSHADATLHQFQSLGRDSVGWDWQVPVLPQNQHSVSIPRSGFCGVGLYSIPMLISSRYRFQSLGRDSVGWDVLPLPGAEGQKPSFNPSVGILWGGTWIVHP